MSNILKIAGAGVSAAAEETDEYFNQTVLLLHGDGTDGTRNNTFLDSSSSPKTIVRNPTDGPNAPTQGTFSPFSAPDGRWSNYFDGETNSYLNTPSTGQFAPTGDFTIAWWYYPVVFQTSVMIANYTGNNTTDWSFETDATGDLNIYLNGSTQRITGSAVLNLNQWNYIVVSRSGSTVTAYCNGSSINTYNFGAGTFGSATKAIRIGAGSAGTNNAEGYISNVYLLDGTALDGTLPTTPFTDGTGVSLLTCQSNRFVDSATPPNAITVNSTGVKVTPFSPFAPTAAYDASVNGGSGYFDGSDYLTVGTSTDWKFLHDGTTAFTIQAWIYIPDTTANPIVIGNTLSSAEIGFAFGVAATDNSILYLISKGTSNTYGLNLESSANLKSNAWNHIAVTHDGSSNYTLYINGTSAGTGAAVGHSASNPTNNTTVAVSDSTAGLLRYLTGYIASLKISDVAESISLPTAPFTNDANTKLLLNFTNAGIFDNTGKNNLETVADAQIDTTTKKYGTGSMEFDGTGDYLVLPSTQDLAFGTGDFTIECWINLSASGASDGVLVEMRSTGASTTGFVFNTRPVTSPSTGFKLNFYTDGGANLATTILAYNTWHHVAVTRASGSVRLFANGVSDITPFTKNNNFSDKPNVTVGESTLYANSNITGFIDDLRITKGVARYTTAFTPPTKAFPDL